MTQSFQESICLLLKEMTCFLRSEIVVYFVLVGHHVPHTYKCNPRLFQPPRDKPQELLYNFSFLLAAAVLDICFFLPSCDGIKILKRNRNEGV